MGVRRILALIAGLPPGSAVHRSIDPHGAGKGWTTQEELLSTIAEVVDYGNRLFYAANTKKGSKQPKPLFIPRPTQPKRRKANSDDLKRIFGHRVKHDAENEKGGEG